MEGREGGDRRERNNNKKQWWGWFFYPCPEDLFVRHLNRQTRAHRCTPGYLFLMKMKRTSGVQSSSLNYTLILFKVSFVVSPLILPKRRRKIFLVFSDFILSMKYAYYYYTTGKRVFLYFQLKETPLDRSHLSMCLTYFFFAYHYPHPTTRT